MEQETREKPEVTTCSDGLVPDGAEAESGERKIRIAEGLSTMPKLFFDTNRLKLYSFLNGQLCSGKLGKIVGFPFTDRVINKKVCRFTGLEFRRIDRENFFTYVFVELALTTAEGLRIWKRLSSTNSPRGACTRRARNSARSLTRGSSSGRTGTSQETIHDLSGRPYTGRC